MAKGLAIPLHLFHITTLLSQLAVDGRTRGQDSKRDGLPKGRDEFDVGVSIHVPRGIYSEATET